MTFFLILEGTNGDVENLIFIKRWLVALLVRMSWQNKELTIQGEVPSPDFNVTNP